MHPRSRTKKEHPTCILEQLLKQPCTARSSRGIAVATLLLAVATTSTALAEEKTDTSGTKSMSLDSISVTANKIEESVKDVPQSISVISDYDIEDKGIKNVEGIIHEVPNMYIGSSFNGSAVNFRGLNSSMFTNNNPVVIYIDGVPSSDRYSFDASMANVERVEVLRGPQGTLYGKDAIGAVINIITKTGDNKWHGTLGAEYGNNNYVQGIFNVSGPAVKDKLFFGVNGQYQRDDGWIKNIYPGMGKDANHKNDQRYSGYLLYKPTNRLSARLTLGYDYTKGGWLDGYGLGGGASVSSANRNDAEFVSYDIATREITESNSQALNITYDFDALSLTSVTTRKKTNMNGVYDADFTSGTAYNGLKQFNTTDLETWTQEFRASSTKKEGFRWVGGVYFDFEQRDQGPYGMEFPFPPFGNFEMNAMSRSDSNTQAVFGQVMIPLVAGFELTAGGRYQQIEKKMDLDMYYLPVGTSGSPMYSLHGKKTWDAFLPKLALSYKINNNLTTYFTWSQGYMPGGFNYFATSGTADDNSFKPQRSTNYELGLKGSYNRLSFAASLFRMDIKDIHVYKSDSTGSIFLTSNAKEAHSQGIELEARYLLLDGLELSAAAGFIDAEYDDYDTGTKNLKGNKIENTPSHTAKIGIAYSHPKGVYARADIRNQGDTYFYDSGNQRFGKQKSYTVADMKVGYRFGDWDIYGYVKNLADEAYVNSYQSSARLTMVGFGEPRTYGAGVRYKF